MRRALAIVAALSFLAPTIALCQDPVPPGPPGPTPVVVTTGYLYLAKMHFAGTWNSTATYNSQDVVYAAGVGYVSLQVGNLNQPPATSPTWWATLIGGTGVTSVFGRVGGVVAVSGDYTTAQVTESGNLYFTAGRAQAALAGLYEFPLTFATGIGRVGNTITCATASTSLFGCLSAADWTAFNGKQAALGFTPLNAASNLSDLVSAPTARTNLGLGTASVQASAFFAHVANNLSDLASAATARTNLGLGSLALLSALPNPSASTLGGIESLAAVTSYWIRSISTVGVPAASQPAFTDISGAASAAQIPTNIRARTIGVVFAGGDIVAGAVINIPSITFSCTVANATISQESGTSTIKVWKLATGGTAVPTVSNSISTSGWSLASGTKAGVTNGDLTTTAITAGDSLSFNLYALSGTPNHVAISMECDQ